jgi:hypothetical protein
MKEASRDKRAVALLAVGFTAWSLVFLLLYAIQAVGCRLSWNHVAFVGGIDLLRLLLVGTYVSALLATVFLYLRLRVRSHTANLQSVAKFLDKASSQSSLAAVGSVAFCFAGVFWLTAC